METIAALGLTGFTLIVVALYLFSGTTSKPVEKPKDACMEVQFFKDGVPETKCVDAVTYRHLMELLENPEENQQAVQMILKNL